MAAAQEIRGKEIDKNIGDCIVYLAKYAVEEHKRKEVILFIDNSLKFISYIICLFFNTIRTSLICDVECLSHVHQSSEGNHRTSGGRSALLGSGWIGEF